MTQSDLKDWTKIVRPVIGMLHAPALPGSPRYSGSLETVMSTVLNDAETLADGGVHGLMLENFGDVPFYPRRVPPETVAAMTRLAGRVRDRFDVPLGINVLRNDGLAALAIAAGVGAEFIRVNVLCGARVTDQGLIEGISHDLLRTRRDLHAEQVSIFADVDVKHSAPLASRPIAEEAVETVHRGGADALIVSGPSTGVGSDVDQLREVQVAAAETPVFVGSGVTTESLPDLWPNADGFIVGTSLKRNGDVAAPVDRDRVRELMQVHASLGER
ncbi:MAG: phosphorybosylanthranilate isomerase [Planctomycetota bacterium]|nr:MAG: phosphorybosylanthranilate isomerase [Planctomycetota bacterium]REJ86643.1 MAG: phosphorybosylanthranilate isomerase [Planctomycetota bacterium]REK28514.1 MAG: phosphorybosylanthranilate isomerase [Planctomycetota bacterium]REK29146.1 MAG: phosphorybosylanthranilate isomerase [Planctomycetota bacterium]